VAIECARSCAEHSAVSLARSTARRATRHAARDRATAAFPRGTGPAASRPVSRSIWDSPRASSGGTITTFGSQNKPQSHATSVTTMPDRFEQLTAILAKRLECVRGGMTDAEFARLVADVTLGPPCGSRRSNRASAPRRRRCRTRSRATTSRARERSSGWDKGGQRQLTPWLAVARNVGRCVVRSLGGVTPSSRPTSAVPDRLFTRRCTATRTPARPLVVIAAATAPPGEELRRRRRIACFSVPRSARRACAGCRTRTDPATRR